jgi:hypothetical protein
MQHQLIAQNYQANKSSKKSLSQKIKVQKPGAKKEEGATTTNTANKKKFTQQSVFNIYNQKMKYIGKSSMVKDFSTGNLNLEELIDRDDEQLSYTDPRN